MNNPLVSVIIPNYNHAEYLDERINSVLNQTYRNFEVIILDDKSTDNSIEVIGKYRDNPQISQILINEKNSGSTFIQWNRGLKIANGELIWIAESDDSCSPILLEELVKAYCNHSHASIVFCRSLEVNSKGVATGKKQKDKPLLYFTGVQFIRKYLSTGNPVMNMSSAIFNRDVALSMSQDYTKYKGAGDRLFLVHLAQYGNVVFVRRQLNYFRRHEGIVTSKRTADGTNAREDKAILDFIIEQGYVSGFRKYCAVSLKRYYVYRCTYTSLAIKKDIYHLWGIENHPISIMIGCIYSGLILRLNVFL